MEDDPGLTAPEIWVNRTLQHMEDAQKYNCSGLLGIHWRTGVTSPQISAMAQKSWNSTLNSIRACFHVFSRSLLLLFLSCYSVTLSLCVSWPPLLLTPNHISDTILLYHCSVAFTRVLE